MAIVSWKLRVWDWFSTHHGIISLAELDRLGCPRTSARRMVAAGELIPVMPGVYRSAAHRPTAESDMVAACARNPHAVVAFVSAGRLWGLRKMPNDASLHLLVPHGCSPEIAGAVVHRCRQIDPSDIVTRPDGIRVTSPPRTIFDVGDMVGEQACASALEQVIDQYCTFATVSRTLMRLEHPRRPGSRTLSRVIKSRPSWQQALQSDLESLVFDEIRGQRLPPPIPQFWCDLPHGDRIRFDFAWPAQRVALEVDAPFWHAFADAVHRDKRRDRQAALLGWLTLRITTLDVHGRLSEAIGEIGTILAHRQSIPA